MDKIQPLNKIGRTLHCIKGTSYDFYFEISSGHNAHYENNRMEEVGSFTSKGVGARVITGDTSAYVYAPYTNVNSAARCMSEAVKNAGVHIELPSTEGLDDSDILSSMKKIDYPNYSFMNMLNKYIRNKSEFVTQVSISLDCSAKKVLIIRDDGKAKGDNRFYSTFIVQVIVQKDNIIQTALESTAFSLPLDKFMRKANPMQAAEKALKRALLMLDAKECPAGTMPVILSGEAGGTMIHEACGHGLEADIIQKDYSIYRNSIGKKVANEKVTLVDDGTIAGYYGTLDTDDEGTPSSKTILIENGILTNYLTDRFSSRKGNLPLSGNGRRSSFRNMPLPRMTNTFIAPGKKSPAEMIRGMSKGIMVKKMGGGEVNPTNGDFVFQVTEGYYIKNGKVLYPIKGAMLTGNSQEVLDDIQEIGNDLSFTPGVCEKNGQSIPVTDGQPTLYIKNLIIGGQETGYESI